jgi:hypothetical protein
LQEPRREQQRRSRTRLPCLTTKKKCTLATSGIDICIKWVNSVVVAGVKMEIKAFGSIAASALTAMALLSPLGASSQPGLQNPSLPDASGVLSLQQGNPSETLNLLQGPSQLSTTADVQGGTLGSYTNPVAVDSLVGGVDARNFPQPAEQSYGPRGNNSIVWSDNRGTWKSDPPGDACMLQSTSQIKSDSCN